MTSNLPAPGRTRRRLIVGAVFAVCAVPVALAWLLNSPFLHWRPTRFSNEGILIDPPRPLGDLQLKAASGDLSAADVLQGKWTLVLYYRGRPCAQRCVYQLQLLRNVQLALGKNVIRTQAVVITGKTWLAEINRLPIASQYPKPLLFTTAQDTRSVLDELFKAGGGTATAIHLIDPNGHYMLRFDPPFTLSAIVSDLKHLLHASRIG